MSDETVEHERCRLRSLPSHQFVDREEFCRLLVSRRGLERLDDPRARARGLLDRSTGVRFLIESERLQRVAAEQAAATDSSS